MAKFEVNYEEKIKAGAFDNFQLLKLDDDGKINLQQLRLVGVLSQEKLEELNKLRLHLSLTNRDLSFEEKWQKIEENNLDVEELRSLGVINDAELDQMKPLPLVDFPNDVWEKVPPVQPNRTDIFVVGGVSSGKTCFLAGLLEYGNRTGKLFVDRITNPGGGIYEDQLRIAVDEGRLFQGTPTDAIQYICADMKDEANKSESPINIFDMSGEVFQFCFAKSKSEIAELYPSFIEYIFSDNPKVFFLALNWKVKKMEMKNQEGQGFPVFQSSLLDNILEFLRHHELIKKEKIKAICLLVTQWDQYPDPKNPNPTDDGLDDFISNNYRQLFKRLMEYEERYGIKFKILPYSLGTFDRRNYYTFEETYSKKATDFLMKTVPFIEARKKGFIDKIFNKD